MLSLVAQVQRVTGGTNMAKKKYLEYDDMTAEQRDQKRLQMLAKLERQMREHVGGTPPKPEEADHPLNRPMYFASDVLDDPKYQGLSVVGKLSWYSRAMAASTAYHMDNL